jgi:glucose-1-phosphate thymidylyltransferase
MKGIVLAGGTGSRLGALSRVTNKHLLPVGSVPMIYHPIAQLIENGIHAICVVSGLFHLGSVVELLGSGSRFGCRFTYQVQDEAGGIAEALSLCRDFAGTEDVAVFLGDNIFGEVLDLSLPKGADAKFFLKKVPDPERFGVAEVDHMKRLVDIEEKPDSPKSDLAVTGAYVYSYVIWRAVDSIGRSARGELEISDANRVIMQRGSICAADVEGWWSDAGTQSSYRRANAEVWDAVDERLAHRLDIMALSSQEENE